jgi:hypothetical protein
MQQPVPRHIQPESAALFAGMPQERAARVAARRAFVDLKRTFIEALNSIDGGPAFAWVGAAAAAPKDSTIALASRIDWLRRQVMLAEEPVDLWLLRAPMFAALAGLDPERRRHRQALRRALEALFPDSELDAAANSAFASLY